MKNEKIKYQREKDFLTKLMDNAMSARRLYLKYEVFDNIMSLLKIDEDRSDGAKWERLYKLQKRISIVKYDLGENEANVLIQEVIEIISEYLNKNKEFREEAFDNIEMFSDIQRKKTKTMEQIFRVEND